MEFPLRPAIIVHGGAGALRELQSGYNEHIQGAVRAGYQLLAGDRENTKSTAAVDAVEAAVRYMEDCPLFNAGTGSVLTEEGTIEMDAVIMEGKDLRAGGVACVKNIKNAISLARMVMDKTDHILLAGEGANIFADKMNVPHVSTESLTVERRLLALKTSPKFKPTVNYMYKEEALGMDDHDTVGAVAVDALGNVACATSTGGINAQMIGRVGDSPLIGGGAYCDNATGAISTTGHGEAIAKIALARIVAVYIEQGMSSQAALEKGLSIMKERLQSQGGAIAVSKDGHVGYHFNTQAMPWSFIQNGQMHYGMNPGEDFVATL